MYRSSEKSMTFKKLVNLKSQSLPSLSSKPAYFSRATSLQENGNQDSNHDNKPILPSNPTENCVVELCISMPDIKTTKRRRKIKRQVSLVNRIDEFYKKLDEFGKKHEQPILNEGSTVLPAVQH